METRSIVHVVAMRRPIRADFDAAASDAAHAEWSFNCGPGAICGLLGLKPEEVRPHMGRCRCGRLRNRPGNLCSVCVEAARAHSDRSEARKRGEHVPPADWKGTRDARRADEAARLRLNVLEEVEAIWQARGGVGLRQWLTGELARLRKGRAA